MERCYEDEVQSVFAEDPPTHHNAAQTERTSPLKELFNNALKADPMPLKLVPAKAAIGNAFL